MKTTTVQRCGGHITLLFTVDKSNTLMRSQGSKGAGFSIHHGVEITAALHREPPHATEVMNGIKPDEPPPKRTVVSSKISVQTASGEYLERIDLYLDYIQACRDATLLRDDEWLTLDVRLECPTSQGFGMSAAGLVALGRAIHALTGRGRSVQYLKMAHRVERTHAGGLGDVLGASVGGVELRLAPGAPGWPGHAVSFEAKGSVLLAWDPLEERHTSTYIDDLEWQRSITRAGEAGVRSLATTDWSVDRWSDLLREARTFATASGMLEEAHRVRIHQAVLEAVQRGGWQASMAVRLCMLGSSVVVLPRRLDEGLRPEDLEALRGYVAEQGFSCLISSIGPLNRLD